MKTIIILAFTFLTSVTNIKPVSTDVYICNSTTASVYHSSKTCKGLDKCTHEIKEVSKEDAEKKYQRRACKVCY